MDGKESLDGGKVIRVIANQALILRQQRPEIPALLGRGELFREVAEGFFPRCLGLGPGGSPTVRGGLPGGLLSTERASRGAASKRAQTKPKKVYEAGGAVKKCLCTHAARLSTNRAIGTSTTGFLRLGVAAAEPDSINALPDLQDRL